MIVSGPNDILTTWLCTRIGLVPTHHIRCIARLSAEKQIMAVIGFDNWNGAACEMHVAGEGNWMNRALLFAAFDYPFRVAGCKMVLGRIPSGNKEAVRLNKHLGFNIECEIEGAHPDGSLIIMSMRRENCRWLEKHHGKEKLRSAA